MNQRYPLGVVILAAGASTRMGKPKMLLPWGDTTILGHEIAVWKSLAALQVVVVIAHGDSGIAAELDRLNFPAKDRIVNPEPSRGMFSSIQCAARWLGWNYSITHFVFVLGDQPHLQSSTFQSLIEFSGNNADEISQPAFQGRARHPVILPRIIFDQLASTEMPTLRDFLQSLAQKPSRVEINDSGLDLDLDHPADYENALRLRNR